MYRQAKSTTTINTTTKSVICPVALCKKPGRLFRSLCIVMGGLLQNIVEIIFSRTCWPRDHYDCATLLTSMNDVALLVGGLHCYEA
jgi:hypothetical protein